MINRSKAREILLGIGEGYCALCVYFVTFIILCFSIFGGKIHIEINWNSWNELIKTLKKH